MTQTPYNLKEDKNLQTSVVMISRETQASKVKKNSTEVKTFKFKMNDAETQTQRMMAMNTVSTTNQIYQKEYKDKMESLFKN